MSASHPIARPGRAADVAAQVRAGWVRDPQSGAWAEIRQHPPVQEAA